MKLYFITILSLISPLFAFAATPVKGVVIDAKTQEEIIGATIQVGELPARGTVSGLDGSFVFSDLEQLPVTLNCSYIGYKTTVVTIHSASDHRLTILLEPDAQLLDEVVVYGSHTGSTDNSARVLEKNSMNVMNIVSARAIEISPDMTVANVIQRVSGVTVERNSSGDGQYAILRGMDKRYNYTLVNGIKIPSPDNKNRFVPLDIFPSELLERLDVAKALTADMEGDGIGGAINLVMKDAPARRQLTANVSTGYNALFFDRDFLSFNAGGIDKRSPYEIYGENYAAQARDFSSAAIDLKSSKPAPNLFAGFSYGDRLFGDRLGIMLAGSYQNSYRGSNSTYFESKTATSDASNLPVLTARNDRTYSEQQTRYAIHGKLDYAFSGDHKLQWYNAYMVFENTQVRDTETTDLSVGYNPEAGDYNLSFDTRFRYTRQEIFNSTLKGSHSFLNRKWLLDWSGVYSKASNEIPDNSTVYTVTTVRDFVQNLVSVTTLGGAERRWERNSDQDWAGYLNLHYLTRLGRVDANFSAGGLYRRKERTNFFNQYDFRPYDESKPEGSQNNLIKGTDWDTYTDIKFTVYNPYGAVGNPLNYDASEEITAGYLQSRLTWGSWNVVAGLRVEHTRQGYDLKYPTEDVENEGRQVYTDYLPGLHLKYSLTHHTNLRASYFKSINRPGFFEIVPYRVINEDFVERGNPDLKHTVAHNVDLRYEYFPRASEQLLVGVFYKKILDPIEFGMVTEGQGTFYMPTNFGNATNYGLEIDVTKYFRAFGIKMNYTFTQSNITTDKLYYVENTDPNTTENIVTTHVDQKRPLNGQAMHVANLSLLYKDGKRGWDAQLAGSYTGERLYAIARYLDNDIWQSGYFQLDASVEKQFRYGITVFAKAANLINAPMKQFIKLKNESSASIVGYETHNGGTLVRKDRYGQTFQIGVKYKL